MTIMQNTERIPLLRKLYTVAIILSTSLFMYDSGIPSVRLAELVLIVLSIVAAFKYGIAWGGKCLALLVFLVIDVCLSLISLTSQDVFDLSIYIRLVRFGMYVLFILVSERTLNRDYFLKALRIISIVVSIYVILQFVMYYVFRVMLPHRILPISIEGDINTGGLIENANVNYFRAYGIFSEPSAVAKFLLPGFAFSLFGWKDSQKIDIWSLVFISTAIIITTSLQGIVVAAGVLVFYLFTRESKRQKVKGRRRRTRVIVTLIVISIIIVVFYLLGTLDGVLSRLENVFPNNVRPGSSNALRLYRGYAVFGEIPLIYKIIGIGHGNVGEFVIANGITTRFDGPMSNMAFAEYTNGIASILLYVGIIGFLVFLGLMISLYKQSSKKYRAIILTFIILQFSGGGIFGIVMVYYFSIIYIGIERKDGVNNTDVLQELGHTN